MIDDREIGVCVYRSPGLIVEMSDERDLLDDERCRGV